MTADELSRYLTAEIESLRREIEAIHAEQRQLIQSIDELTRTFRALATHLGIAAEPYGGRTGTAGGGSAPTGFG
ncbi:MAG: hypothetical protein ACYDFT_07535 [Thermoplasmata archaeon]